MDPAQAGVLGALLLGASTATIVIATIIWYLLYVIADWKIFKKMGEPGWKSIIPLYNFYIQCKRTWSTGGFWWFLLSSILTGVFRSILESVDSGTTAHVLCTLGQDFFAVVAFILTICAFYWMARSFGHGGGFTILFIFFNVIMTLILGLGSSKYQGNLYAKKKQAKKGY